MDFILGYSAQGIEIRRRERLCDGSSSGIKTFKCWPIVSNLGKSILFKPRLLLSLSALLLNVHLQTSCRQVPSQRLQIRPVFPIQRIVRFAPSSGLPTQFQDQKGLHSPFNLGGEITVPGSAQLLAHRRQDLAATNLVLVKPYENYISNSSSDSTASYVIENKRFVEAVSTRCFASTILEDPASVEPSFIIIKPTSEIRLNATAPLELIQMAGFEPNKRTTILVHGFTQSYPSTTWLRRVRALYEQNSLIPHYNLIIMDWGVASHGSYAQVAATVSGMGSFLANFVGKLLELGANRMSIHIIGHSLGAHLAGFAGKRIRPRLGRITALDPAGPCFGKIFSNSPTDRLSPDDAYEVDVYHYDDDFLGLPGQHGQFDVYVNGGSRQPGCKDNMNSMFEALITVVFRRNRVLSESHTRSTEVCAAQLSSTGCQQVAYECRNYAAFTQGECGKCDHFNNQCFLMGFDFQYADKHEPPLRSSFPGKRLYISTGSNEFFCSHHYQILVKFEPSLEMAKASKRNKWRIQLDLMNDSNERVSINVSHQMAPNVFSYLLLTEPARPTRIKGAQMQVRAPDGLPVQLLPSVARVEEPRGANKDQRVSLTALSIEVNFMSNINPLVRRSLSSRLCPMDFQLPSPGGGPAHFRPPALPEMNSIADSSPLGHQDQWLTFDECLSSSLNGR